MFEITKKDESGARARAAAVACANRSNYLSITVSLGAFFVLAFLLYVFSSAQSLVTLVYLALLPTFFVFLYLNLITRFAAICFNKNMVLRDYGRIVQHYQRSLALVDLLPWQKGPYKATLLCHMGLAEVYRGNLVAAQDAFEEALSLVEKRGHTITTQVMQYNLGCVWLKMRNLPRAALAFETASMPLSPRAKKHSPVFLAMLRLSIGHLELLEGDYLQAADSLKKADEIIKNAPQIIPGDLLLRQALLDCQLHLASGQKAQAANDLQKILQAPERDLTTTRLDQLNDVAALAFQSDMYEEAEKLYDMAYALECSFPLHPECAATVSGLEKIFLVTGREDQVPDMKQWLRLSKSSES